MDGDAGLGSEVHAWVQAIADRDHGGDWAKAAAVILTAAHAAEQQPRNPWAYLERRQAGRVR